MKKAPRDASGVLDIEIEKEALIKAFRTRVHVKRAGRKFEQLRRDDCNGHLESSRECPFDIAEANRQMAHYRPIHITKEAKCRRRISNDDFGREHFLVEKGKNLVVSTM